MKKYLKRLILAILHMLFPGLGDRACILMYHSVGVNELFHSVRPTEFERQVQYLKQKNFDIVDLRKICSLVKGGHSLQGMVAITFDDGYEDVYINAFPIIKKYNIPVTIFMVTGLMGSEANFLKTENKINVMQEDHVREMSASGLVTFMPHTVTHPDLSKISIENAKREIEQSRKDVERITGKPADIFAYPKGKFNDEVIEYLRTDGRWLGAVTANTGLVHDYDGPYKLRRIPVDTGTTFAFFKIMLSRAIDVYQALKPING